MTKFKILASDLDGTLLNNQHDISKENIDAINGLSKEGVTFVPATGRTLSEIPKKIKDISSIRYILHSNGAVVLDRKTGKKISNCIPNDVTRELLDILSKFETHITYRCDGELYVEAGRQKAEDFEYYNVCVPHQVVIRDFAIHLDDFYHKSSISDDVEVFSVFFHSLEEKNLCCELIEQTNKLKTVSPDEHNLEIMNIKAGKGNALLALADMLGVPHEQVIAVGDSDNDYSLIDAAGFGIVVSNGCEKVKAIADSVICSNDEHAIEYILEHIIKQ